MVVKCPAVFALAALTIVPGTANQVHEAVASSMKVTVLTKAQIAQLSNLGNQNADVLYGLPTTSPCQPSMPKCNLGDRRSAKIAVLYGDSHARMWLPAILPTLTAERYRVVILGRDGCTVMDNPLSTCPSIQAAALAQIRGLKPEVTIISDYSGTGTTSQTMRHPTAGAWRTRLESLLHAIPGRKVVIGDITQLNLDPQECLAVFWSSVQQCSAPNPNPTEPTLQSAEIAAAAALKIPYIDPRHWLCSSRCSPVVGNLFTYWSSNHVTVQYAAYLSKVMGTALSRVL